MAELQATVEWPGLEAVESFSGTLSHGSSPSVFRISCFPQRKPPKKSGKLTLRYGNFKMTLDDCIIDSASYSFNQSGDIIGLNILDRRWRWRGGFILGSYNTAQYSGGLLPGKAVGSKNLRELMKLCLNEMGERNADLSDVSISDFPSVQWDYDNPATALQQLCTRFNYRIVLQTNDKVKICKANQGKRLDNKLPYEGYGTALDTPDLPDSVMVVGKPLLVEFDSLLYAVGQERSGEWKPIDELSYKPTGGWTTTNPGIEVQGDQTADDLSNGLATRYVWRAYALGTTYRANNKELDKHKLPTEYKRDAVRLVNELNLVDLPVYRNIAYPALGSFVWGKYYAPELFDAVNDHNTNTVKPILTDTNTIISDSNLIQIQHQIITTESMYIVLFNEPIYSLATGVMSEASIRLRSFFEVGYSQDKTPGLDYSPKPAVRYTEYELLGNPKNGKNLPLIFNRDDLERIYDIKGKLISGDVKQIAKRYLRERIDQLKNEQPEEAAYTGWHDIELDGAIQVVSWAMGQDGVTMRVSRNQDYGTDTTLSYAERLRYQEQKAQQDAIEKLKKEQTKRGNK